MPPNEPGFGWTESFLGGSEQAEERMFRDFERTIVALQRSMAQRADSTVRRGFHAKTILNVPRAVVRCASTIPRVLQAGLFQPDREYPAVVRFSSSLADVQPDGHRQGHGIGFRIITPQGIHDVLLSDSPTSHARDAEQFMALADALTSKPRIVTVARLVRRVGFSEAIRMLRVVLTTSTSNMPSVATASYWTRTAFAFGGAAARLVLRPRDAAPASAGRGPDYLGAELTRRLATGDVVFELAAQLYRDPTRTPIEDGSVNWLESDTPPIPLARLTLPRQDLTSADARTHAAAIEEIAFTPWNVVGDIRPLGSMNRARRPVYLASARARGGALTSQESH
jgi:catalase